MSKKTQTGAIDIDVGSSIESTAPTVIKVENVSMVFNMASQQLNSLKEYVIALLHRNLMFKEFRALNDISLDVKKGDVYGILGTNGSGKSTLLKIVSGILTPTEGSVEIHGKIAPLIEMTAGFDMELTARENIYLNGSLLGYTKKYIRQNFDDIVEFAEIEDFLDMPMKNYSSGMIARTAFAIATVMVPDILIADEVLSVGDFMFKEKCERRIQDLIHNHGVTVLIVSHSIEQIERLCNKAIWIEKSHPRLIGNAKDVSRVYKMLGGHSGSAESEKTILDVLQSKIDYEAVKQETIASKSKYDTAIDIFEKCRFEATDAVVLSHGDDIPARILAVGLAGALNAPAFIVKGDETPERTVSAIRKLKPSRIVIIEGTEPICDDAISPLRSLDGLHGVKVERISESEVSVLSEMVKEYAGRYGMQRDSLRVSEGDIFTLAAISPLLYNNGTICLFDGEVEAGTVLDRYRPLEECQAAVVCNEQGKEVYGHLGFDSASPLGQFQNQRKSTSFVLTTSHDFSDALSASMLVAQERVNLALLNHGDLDSLARAIEDVEDHERFVAELVFIGGSYCFNDIDKELLAKAVRINQEG